MENEQSNLSSVSGENVSELAVNVSDESFLGQNENPVEDSYVVEDGGELMVEIVGSDVLLDGMSPIRVVSRDLEVKCNESVAVSGVSSRGDDETVDDNSANAYNEATEIVKDPIEASVVGEMEIGSAEVFIDGMRPNHVVSRDLEVKCSKSVAVSGVSSRGDDETVDDNSANANHGATELVKDPVEASVFGEREIGGIEVDTDMRETKDDDVDDSSANANQGATELVEAVVVGEISGIEVDTDVRETKDDAVDDKGVPHHVNDSVEAVTEGVSSVGMMVTEESATESEGADDNCLNDENIVIPQIKVVNENKASKTGEGIDTELFEAVLECQGTATALVKDPVEASVVGEREIGAIEVDTDMRETKDDDVDDKGIPDHVNNSVEAVTEAQMEISVGMMVTEKSAIESEGAENNCLNDIEIPRVKVVDVDKPKENGEGIDTELVETFVVGEREIGGAEVFFDGMRPNRVVSGDLDVKCSESVAVSGVSSRGDETVDDSSDNVNHGATELVKDPVEASDGGEREIGGAEVDTDVRGIKDDAMDINCATDHVKDSVEAVTEGESSVGMMVTEESAIESEAAEHNCLNDENIEIPQVKVVDMDKPRGNYEGNDTELIEELLECQGTSTIQELDAPTEKICLSSNDTENQATEDTPVVNAETGVDNFVEESRSPQNKELEVSLQKNDAEHDDVDMSESVEVAASNDDINKSREFEEDSSKNHGNHSSETRLVDVEMETELHQKYHQEDSSKSLDNRFSETGLVDVGKETEMHQEYHQEEEIDAEIEQLSDEGFSSRKRKALDPLTDGPDKRANFNAASTDQHPKSSFKIGECILRVASQLTSSTSMVVTEISAESSSVIDMLSQFQVVAQGPGKPHEFRDEILTFFSGFRSSVVANKRSRKKKSDKSVGGSVEDFEFDDSKDSYWTDMIVQNSPEKQMLHNNENGQGRLQLAAPVNVGRKPQSRKKRYFTGHIPPNTSNEFEEKAKRMKQETSPAELILNFAERKFVPSEINLNKIFRRFGPLMESETEVDYESGQARVIFKRGSDAEVAHASSQKFSIFGPVLVNYQIGYSPLISVKISPLTIS